MKIYNSLTRRKDPFEPIKAKRVGMYVCGPTVYDQAHLGHARAAYIFEVIRSYLEYQGYKVKFVKNITDVDDKIIAQAKKEFPTQEIDKACAQVAEKYTRRYYKDMNALDIRRASIRPFATKHIGPMIKYIAVLIKKGYAYESDGSVYFDVRKFKEYGALSGQDLDAMQSAARTEKDENKRNPLDFALWKKAKENEPFWMSPWGKGRPGWHIECSVMSSKYLGNEFDIHGGGRDLIFPHHENEIAQSRCYSGKTFARIWMHNGLLTINGQKMAKSLGNFVSVRDFLKRYSADVLKLFFLQSRYAQPIDFTWERMEEKKEALKSFEALFNRISQREEGGQYVSSPEIKSISVDELNNKIEEAFKDFAKYMDDDFKTSQAMVVLFDLRDVCNKILYSTEFTKKYLPVLKRAAKTIKELGGVFGLSFVPKQSKSKEEKEEIERLKKKREELRKKKMFKEADQIREELIKSGEPLEDKRVAR